MMLISITITPSLKRIFTFNYLSVHRLFLGKNKKDLFPIIPAKSLPTFWDGFSMSTHATVEKQTLRNIANIEIDHNGDRKSTRLNSSHVAISYAVFCLKKKKTDKEV